MIDGQLTCGYSAWIGPKDPVSGFQAVDQIGVYFFNTVEVTPAGAQPADIPGVDRAWFEDGMLKVVVGQHMMGITCSLHTGKDSSPVAITVARAILQV
jgi:hypothetical protein